MEGPGRLSPRKELTAAVLVERFAGSVWIPPLARVLVQLKVITNRQ